MISFLRKIRQKLLAEKSLSRPASSLSGGQTGVVVRYLLYALGETLLVVFGILIALQINNWNFEKQQKLIEREYLEEIKANLSQDLGDIHFNLDFNQVKLRSSEIVLEYLNNDSPYSDSLNFHFAQTVVIIQHIVPVEYIGCQGAFKW